MSIEANIIGKIDSNNVQVAINSSKNSAKPNYYKVSEREADAFIADYDKTVKRNTILSNVCFGSSIFAGILLAGQLTKNIKNSALKWGINVASGIACAIGSVAGCGAYFSKSHEACLKRHNAEQLHYDA